MGCYREAIAIAKAWKRRNILDGVRYFYKKARSILIDWARKVGLRIVLKAIEKRSLIALEDLNGLIESLRVAQKP